MRKPGENWINGKACSQPRKYERDMSFIWGKSLSFVIKLGHRPVVELVKHSQQAINESRIRPFKPEFPNYFNEAGGMTPHLV